MVILVLKSKNPTKTRHSVKYTLDRVVTHCLLAPCHINCHKVCMDKTKLRPAMKFLEKTGLIYQISLENFHGGW